MIDYTPMLSINPFSYNKKEKDTWFFENQKILSKFHYDNCTEYKNIVDKIFINLELTSSLIDLPFVPARIFKYLDMKSKSDKEISVTLTSSGTSSNNVSKIKLDKRTSLIQSRVLNRIFSTILPRKKYTFFFVEQENQIKNNTISARTAAIRGFSHFVKDTKFMLDSNSKIVIDELNKFINENPDEPYVIFGFTSLVWIKLVLELKKKNIKLCSNNGIMLHGGGWKKLTDQAVTRKKFNDTVSLQLGISAIHNYYGMVEQTGSVFLECEEGFFHSSIFSDVLIRNKNLEIANLNEEGLIQVLSLLPQSYPGHNILTEDIGMLIGIDNCKCGRKGKYFNVNGRVQGAELRGCSDVY